MGGMAQLLGAHRELIGLSGQPPRHLADASEGRAQDLLGVADPWLTPWHASAVIDKYGTTLMHRADAEALGAKLVLDGTRPSHLELA